MTLTRDDALLLRRYRKGSIPAERWTHRLRLRIVWCGLRSEGRRQALVLFRHVPWSDDPGSAVVDWLRLVADLDATDSTPARTSVEFVWRHPELADGSLHTGPAGPARAGSEPPLRDRAEPPA